MLDKEKILSNKLKRSIFELNVNCEKVFVVTLSDLHIGVGDREYIKNIIDFILSVPNMYVILGGDAVNNVTKTSKGNVLEEYATGQAQIDILIEFLKPLVEENRIIAICGGGNHERRTYEDCFISIPEIVAKTLGIEHLYISDIAIGYINVWGISYIYSIIHKHKKANNYYDYMNADVLIMEHTHELNYKEKLVLNHNPLTKITTVKSVYEINNGSALALPFYARFNGYRMLNIGCYITEFSGLERDIIIWKDTALYKAIRNGYQVEV